MREAGAQPWCGTMGGCGKRRFETERSQEASPLAFSRVQQPLLLLWREGAALKVRQGGPPPFKHRCRGLQLPAQASVRARQVACCSPQLLMACEGPLAGGLRLHRGGCSAVLATARLFRDRSLFRKQN